MSANRLRPIVENGHDFFYEIVAYHSKTLQRMYVDYASSPQQSNELIVQIMEKRPDFYVTAILCPLFFKEN